MMATERTAPPVVHETQPRPLVEHVAFRAYKVPVRAAAAPIESAEKAAAGEKAEAAEVNTVAILNEGHRVANTNKYPLKTAASKKAAAAEKERKVEGSSTKAEGSSPKTQQAALPTRASARASCPPSTRGLRNKRGVFPRRSTVSNNDSLQASEDPRERRFTGTTTTIKAAPPRSSTSESLCNSSSSGSEVGSSGRSDSSARRRVSVPTNVDLNELFAKEIHLKTEAELIKPKEPSRHASNTNGVLSKALPFDVEFRRKFGSLSPHSSTHTYYSLTNKSTPKNGSLRKKQNPIQESLHDDTGHSFEVESGHHANMRPSIGVFKELPPELVAMNESTSSFCYDCYEKELQEISAGEQGASYQTLEEMTSSAAKMFQAAEKGELEISNHEMEITPGVYVPFRGVKETWRAVATRGAMQSVCLDCGIALLSVQDCEHVLCPDCHMVNPVFENPPEVVKPFGVGMGLKEDWMHHQKKDCS